MFGFLKNLAGKLARKPADSTEPTQSEFSPPAAPPPPPAVGAKLAAPEKNGHQNGKGIPLPLSAILAGLPLELQPKLLHPDVGDFTIAVPLEKILAQLGRGAVKISFRELRLAAPGVFSSDDDRDAVLVSLPLAEVLARLNPALITRRRVQKQVEVPAEISSPFDAHGNSLVFSVGPAKPAPAPAPAAPPPQRTTTPAASPSAGPVRD